jgi:hypothetical protein
MNKFIVLLSFLLLGQFFLSASNDQKTEIILQDTLYCHEQLLQRNQKRCMRKLFSLLEERENNKGLVTSREEEHANFIDPYTGGGFFLLLVMLGICVYPVIEVCCSRPAINSGLTVLGDCCSRSLYDIENPESE